MRESEFSHQRVKRSRAQQKNEIKSNKKINISTHQPPPFAALSDSNLAEHKPATLPTKEGIKIIKGNVHKHKLSYVQPCMHTGIGTGTDIHTNTHTCK